MRKPRFELTRVLESGPPEEPMVVSVKELPWGTRMGRRGFLGTSVTASALLALGAGSELLSSSVRGQVAEGAFEFVPAHSDGVSALTVTPDGRYLISGSNDNLIKIWSLRESKLVRTLRGHSDSILALALSADGSLLASGSRDKTVRLWKIPDGRLRATVEGHSQPVRAVAVSSLGEIVFSSEGFRVRTWSVRDGGPLDRINTPSEVTTLAMAGPGLLAVGLRNHLIQLWSWPGAELLRELAGHRAVVDGLSATAESDLLISRAGDGVRVWSLPDGRPLSALGGEDPGYGPLGVGSGFLAATRGNGVVLRSFSQVRELPFLPESVEVGKHDNRVASISVSPDERLFATTSDDGATKIWSLSDGLQTAQLDYAASTEDSLSLGSSSLVLGSTSGIRVFSINDLPRLPFSGRLLTPAKGPVTAVAVSADGSRVAAAPSLEIWSLPDGRKEQTIDSPIKDVGVVKFSPDGKTLAFGSSTFAGVGLWSVGETARVLRGPVYSRYGDLSFSSDGAFLASASDRVVFWSVGHQRPVASISATVEPASSVRFSPSGRYLGMASGRDLTICALGEPGCLSAMEPSMELELPSRSRVVVSPSGGLAASVRPDGRIEIRSLPDWVLRLTLEGHPKRVGPLAFSWDDQWLASNGGVGEKGIKLWSLSSGRGKTLKGHRQAPDVLVFSPEGRFLASGSTDQTVILWSIPKGKKIKVLKHSASVQALAFSRDGGTLATASLEPRVRLWSVSTGTALESLEAFDGGVAAICFAAAGDHVAFASRRTQTVRIWSLTERKAIHTTKTGISPQFLALSPNGRFFAAGADSTLELSATLPYVPPVRLEGLDTRMTGLAATARGTLLASSFSQILEWRWPQSPFFQKCWRQEVPIQADSLRFAGKDEIVVARTPQTAGRNRSTGKIFSWNPSTGEPVRQIELDQGEGDFAPSPDGGLVATLRSKTAIHLRTFPEYGPLATLSAADALVGLTISGDGRLVVGWGNTVQIWDLPEPAQIRRLGPVWENLEGRNPVALSKDGGTLLATGSKTGALRIWKTSDGEPIATVESGAAVGKLAFAADGSLLFGAASTLSRWRKGQLKAERSADLTDGPITAVAASDGFILAVCGRKSVELFSAKDLRRVKRWTDIVRGGASLGATPTTLAAIADSKGSDIRLMSIPEGHLIAKLPAHDGGVTALDVSASGRWLISGDGFGAIRRWRLPEAENVRAAVPKWVFEFGSQTPKSIAITPDGSRLAVGLSNGSIAILAIDGAELISQMFDPATTSDDDVARSFSYWDRALGRTVTYTLPCGSPIPPGAVCTCNCVSGTMPAPRSTGGFICTCDMICTCVPICQAHRLTHEDPLIHALATDLILAMGLSARRYLEWVLRRSPVNDAILSLRRMLGGDGAGLPRHRCEEAEVARRLLHDDQIVRIMAAQWLAIHGLDGRQRLRIHELLNRGRKLHARLASRWAP